MFKFYGVSRYMQNKIKERVLRNTFVWGVITNIECRTLLRLAQVHIIGTEGFDNKILQISFNGFYLHPGLAIRIKQGCIQNSSQILFECGRFIDNQMLKEPSSRTLPRKSGHLAINSHFVYEIRMK